MKYCIFLFTLLTLGACSSSKWLAENGLRADKNTLTNALNQCDFKKRRKEALAYIDQLNGNSASTPITKEQTTQDTLDVDKDTIECMALKGFKLS